MAEIQNIEGYMGVSILGDSKMTIDHNLTITNKTIWGIALAATMTVAIGVLISLASNLLKS